MDGNSMLDTALAERIADLDCVLFEGLNASERATFLQTYVSSLRQYPADYLLRQQGSDQADFGLVLSGKVEVRQYDDQGNIFTVDLLDAGELFGEMTAFVNPARWPATVVSNTSCKILFLPIHLLAKPSTYADPSLSFRISENLLRLLAGKALNLRARINILTKHGMRQRIAVYLLQCSQQHDAHSFTLALNREGMARYLNVSRPSMSRELGRMQDEGLIRFERNEFTILSKERLIAEAGTA